MKVRIFIILFFLGFYLFNCSSITYKVLRKQNLQSLDIYREVEDTNSHFLFGILPRNRTNHVDVVCHDQKKNLNFEKRNSTISKPPPIVRTNYSFISSITNLFLGILYSRRNIQVFCNYD